MFADQTTIPLIALYRSGTDPAVTHTDGRITAGIMWLDTSTGATGTLKKRNEANSGWDTLINLDAAPSADHAASHENGGGDEISVAGLSGLLADPQTPTAHKTSHQNGGSDEIDVTGLSGLLADPQTPDTHSHSSAEITDFAEAVEDKIGAKVVAGSGISVSYNDTTGETTVTNSDPGTGGTPSTEAVQDIVGAMLLDGGVDFSYDDGAGTIANVIKTSICIACSDETTALTSGTAKVTFRMPHAMTLTDIRASLSTAQASGSIFTVDVNEGGTTILSTKITIDNTEKTSTTAATPPVISDAALADDAEITIDIDQVGDGTAKGLKVYLIGTRS